MSAHAQTPIRPTRAGRVSHVSGGVSVQPAGLTSWVPAAVNRVVSDGDHVFSSELARAELQLGHLVVRLDANTVLEIQQLSAHGARLALLQGRADITLLEDAALNSDRAYEVDMPTAATNLLSRGAYTLRAAPDGTVSSLTVRRGAAAFFVDGTAHPVEPGTMLRARDRQVPQLRNAPAADAFEDWARDRQRRNDAAPALRTLRPDVVGYEELDAHGTWSSSREHGLLWRPTDVPAGWAPYHDGQWSYTRAWGWTWNDAAPWGFAPSHYGRWVALAEGWAWAPGRGATAGGDANEMPVYAPATVAFLQLQDADELTAARVEGAEEGETLTAWVPLAPGEPLMASYGGAYRAPGMGSVARTVPQYLDRPGAVVLGSRAAFRHAAPVHARAVLQPQTLALLQPVNGGQVATPTLASVMAVPPSASVAVPHPPLAALTRMVVAHAPQPPRPARLMPPPVARRGAARRVQP